MSSQPRPVRRDRRAAVLAERRAVRRPALRTTHRIGLGAVSALALGGGLVLVAVLLVLGGPKAVPLSVAVGAAPSGIRADGMVLGQPDAPVTIDLYEDFQCPACEAWGQNVFPSLVRNELAAGTVRIAFHSFAFIGPESRLAAQAAWAADRQGRFWDMWATLYANQGLHENGGSFTQERLVAMAAAIGLDSTRFGADLGSAPAATWVSDGVAAANAGGISSTPTVLIDGAVPASSGYADVSAAIVAAAAAAD